MLYRSVLFSTHGFTTRTIELLQEGGEYIHMYKQWLFYLCFLSNGTWTTTPMAQQVVEARTINAFLFPDLSTNHGPTVDVQEWH